MSVGDWKRAYEAQMETWRWVRSDTGRRARHMHFRENAEGMSEGTIELMSTMWGVEEDKLLHADPIYVSREMCELAAHAAESFKPEPILETDFLTDQGFLYFEDPFVMPDQYGLTTAVGAVSWCRMHAQNQETGEVNERGVCLSLYARPSSIPTLEEVADEPSLPELLPIHHTPWWYGMELDGNEFDERGIYTGVDRWWRVVQTTLRLMQQQITVRHRERPDRAVRRRGARLGFEEREVIVVKLRREYHGEPGEGTGEPAHYSHRFIVGGHWRNQWYPASGVHRQIWISPYVKGPEDQPLVVKPKRVYVFER